MTGVFSIIPFLGCLTYTVTKFNTLNIKIVGAKVLVIILLLMTASQIVFFTTPTKFFIDALTTIGVFIVSGILLRNIRKQNEQKEQIETLATGLENAAAPHGNLRRNCRPLRHARPARGGVSPARVPIPAAQHPPAAQRRERLPRLWCCPRRQRAQPSHSVTVTPWLSSIRRPASFR